MQAEDDARDSFISPSALCTADAHDTLSFDDLEILIKELAKEVTRVRRDLELLITSTEDNVIKSLRPKGLLQV